MVAGIPFSCKPSRSGPRVIAETIRPDCLPVIAGDTSSLTTPMAPTLYSRIALAPSISIMEPDTIEMLAVTRQSEHSSQPLLRPLR